MTLEGVFGLNIAYGYGVLHGLGVDAEHPEQRQRYACSAGAFESQFRAGHRDGYARRYLVRREAIAPEAAP